jgi:hypothetical protein
MVVGDRNLYTSTRVAPAARAPGKALGTSCHHPPTFRRTCPHDTNERRHVKGAGEGWHADKVDYPAFMVD